MSHRKQGFPSSMLTTLGRAILCCGDCPVSRVQQHLETARTRYLVMNFRTPASLQVTSVRRSAAQAWSSGPPSQRLDRPLPSPYPPDAWNSLPRAVAAKHVCRHC